MYRLLILLLPLLCCGFLTAQDSEELGKKKKSLQAKRVISTISVDGVLDELDWQNADIATGFIQNNPNPGEKASQETIVKVIYDDDAIYIGAFLQDDKPEEILAAYSERDELRNTDFFGLSIDAYQDNINGNTFVVTPVGIQLDSKIGTGNEDVNWNAVWVAEARITDNGWIAEIKIPYSALRFPAVDVQEWNINFTRSIRRAREQSWWSHVDPEVAGFYNQAGSLQGIESISPPMRLFLFPYLSTTLDTYSDPTENSRESDTRIAGGLDLKYGLNEAFTLDMTLVPNFDNVRSDNQVLNLSPFEVQFDETRQFFTEGTELFNKAGIFYSRRIGGNPLHYDNVEDSLEGEEEIRSNPSKSQLLNASKISGRTKNNLGIGFFNALVGKEEAVIYDPESDTERIMETNPVTNYNIIAFDQGLANNSFLHLVNTNVTRFGEDYDANVTGLIASFQNKQGTYGFGGRAIYNQKYDGYTGEDSNGYALTLGVKKISGKLISDLDLVIESDNYDPNDLGLLFNNNSLGVYNWTAYIDYDGFGPFRRFEVAMSSGYERLYKPNKFTNIFINPQGWVIFKSFDAMGLWATFEPIETYDYFETRAINRYYTWPVNHTIGGWISTDYRKTLALDLRSNYRWFEGENRHRHNYQISPRWRVNDRMLLIYSYDRRNWPGDIGYATTLDDEDEIIFGARNRVTIENLLESSYIFTNRMGLSLRLRHYWSKAEYQSYHLLDQIGYLAPTSYNGIDEEDGSSLHDSNFSAFNIDMNLRWQFAPGSEAVLTWKNAISSSGEDATLNFAKSFDELQNDPRNNSVTLKVLYFLDAMKWKKA